MARTKKQNREIEVQNKRRKLIERGIFALVALLILGGIGWTIWSTQNMRWVVRFNGERISTTDLRYYELAFQGDLRNPDERDFIVDGLVTALTILDRANHHRINLTEAETADSLDFADNQIEFFGWLGEGFADTMPSRERIAEFFSVNFLREHLLDIYVANFQVNEAEFEEAWLQFQEDNYDDFISREIMYIFNEDQAEIWAAYDASYERPFFTLEEFSTTSVFTMDLNEFGQLFGISWDDFDAIVALEVGSAIPLEVGTGFVLVYLNDVSPPDWDEWEERFRDNFVFSERQTVLDSYIENWKAAARIVYNNRRLNAF